MLIAAVLLFLTTHSHITLAESISLDSSNVQLGSRPLQLINDMDDSPLKDKLASCANGPFKKTDFSIAHRGAPLHFPEHTKESYIAAAKMGAGIIECDVTFTKDRVLVCRHSQCDLHTTTNILTTPLVAKCSAPFRAAIFDKNGNLTSPATAKCCTSDITLAEFKSLKGKMETFNKHATTVQEYINDPIRPEKTKNETQGSLLTHAESIQLFKSLGVKMIPELKSASVAMPYEGAYSQQDYAQQLINEYKTAGIAPENVWVQSFNYHDVLYWLNNEPEFGKQAVLLDGRFSDNSFDHKKPATWSPEMHQIAADGINIIAPPMWMLVGLDRNNKITPSIYADKAKAAGLRIITWTLERSGDLTNGGGWYYQTTTPVIKKNGHTVDMLHVLAKDIGVLGVFSDWPAISTYYANCMNIN